MTLDFTRLKFLKDLRLQYESFKINNASCNGVEGKFKIFLLQQVRINLTFCCTWKQIAGTTEGTDSLDFY